MTITSVVSSISFQRLVNLDDYSFYPHFSSLFFLHLSWKFNYKFQIKKFNLSWTYRIKRKKEKKNVRERENNFFLYSTPNWQFAILQLFKTWRSLLTTNLNVNLHKNSLQNDDFRIRLILGEYYSWR